MGKNEDDVPSPVLLAKAFLERHYVVWYRESAYLRDGHVWRKLEDRELRWMIVLFVDEVLA